MHRLVCQDHGEIIVDPILSRQGSETEKMKWNRRIAAARRLTRFVCARDRWERLSPLNRMLATATEY